MFKHSFFWLIAAFFLAVAIPILSSPEAQWSNARSELEMMESAFGKGDTLQTVRSATATYNALFVDTGLVKKTDGAKVSQAEHDLAERVAGGMATLIFARTNNYIETFSAMVYVMLLRIHILVSWLPYIVPFLLAAICEGYVRRKIKYATFGQYGVLVYSGAQHFAIAIMALPLLYLIAPFPFTPYFVPFWGLAAGIPIVLLVANASQILPR